MATQLSAPVGPLSISPPRHKGAAAAAPSSLSPAPLADVELDDSYDATTPASSAILHASPIVMQLPSPTRTLGLNLSASPAVSISHLVPDARSASPDVDDDYDEHAPLRLDGLARRDSLGGGGSVGVRMANIDDEALDASPSDAESSSRSLLMLSWFALVGSVLAMSATGPIFLHLQHAGVSPILACVWRNQCTCVVLLWPTLLEWRRLSAAERQWEHWRVKGSGSLPSKRAGSGALSAPGQDWHALWYCAAVSVEWSCSLVLWVTALAFTTTARASLLTSIYPLLLVLWLKYGPTRGAVSSGEIAGVVVSFAGIVLTEGLSLFEHAPAAAAAVVPGVPLPSGSLLLMGDLLCLSSAVFIAMDIVLSKRARQVMPLFAYSLVTCFLCLLLLTGLSLILEDTVLFSMHPRHGAFGWLSSPSLAGLTVAFGLLEGLVGVLGFNFAVKYVPPLIFSSVQLLDPGITGLMSWGAGLEAFPSASTFVGIGVVAVGIGIVVVQQHRREADEAAAGIHNNDDADANDYEQTRPQYQMVNMNERENSGGSF